MAFKAKLSLGLALLLGACATTPPAPEAAPLTQTAAGKTSPTETLVFGFRTDDGKRVALMMAEDESTMVCRIYQDERLVLDYPEDRSRGFSAFTKSGYFRGGGPGNAGLDLNYCHFEQAGDHYKLYDEYSAEDDATRIGIDINGSEYEGLPESQEGSLSSLRYIDEIKTGGPNE